MKSLRSIVLLMFLIFVLKTESFAQSSESFVTLGKDAGPCRKFTGNVEILLVFVSTPLHPWTQEQKDAVNRVSFSSVDIMTQEAQRYGADLNLFFGGLDFSIPYEYNKDLQWYYYILKTWYHTSSITDMYDAYKDSLGQDETPVVFLFNSWDVSHTYQCRTNNLSWNEEFCVIFCDTDMHDNYLTHEVLHLYGAIDLYDYNQEGVQRIAEQYFPNSDMLTISHEIDELTAYLIGWTNTPSPAAQAFINETQGLR